MSALLASPSPTVLAESPPPTAHVPVIQKDEQLSVVKDKDNHSPLHIQDEAESNSSTHEQSFSQKGDNSIECIDVNTHELNREISM